jgi:hypothetical protein
VHGVTDPEDRAAGPPDGLDHGGKFALDVAGAETMDTSGSDSLSPRDRAGDRRPLVDDPGLGQPGGSGGAWFGMIIPSQARGSARRPGSRRGPRHRAPVGPWRRTAPTLAPRPPGRGSTRRAHGTRPPVVARPQGRYPAMQSGCYPLPTRTPNHEHL